jgi:hypothetical protein
VILTYALILLLLLALFCGLGIQFFRVMRHALETGDVDGLFLGRKRYRRSDHTIMYWANVCAAAVGAGLGAIVLLWAILTCLAVILYSL